VGVALGYMGTKRYLASTVADVISTCKKGIVLDAFAGMCSVGEAVGGVRTVWNNDVQIFASEVARALFTSASMPLSASEAVAKIYTYFCVNRNALQDRFSTRIQEENNALNKKDVGSLILYQQNARHVGNDAELNKERIELAIKPRTAPYRLAAISFADGYFGLAQSIEIDSIRFAVDNALDKKEINADEHRWLVIALCLASTKVATTTGHFAQYMKPSEGNFKRFSQQRKKSVWSAWLECLVGLEPIGSTGWRRKNKVFRQDSLSLFGAFCNSEKKPAVVYADPPYTADHYSRYYHILETLVMYDYPTCAGEGRYRPDRFATPFSIKTKLVESLDVFVKGCRNIGADLVLSYPNNGLLEATEANMIEILKKHYRRVQIVHSINYQHSTMGASKGASKNDVKELIYLARP
jgi:adenine-specific DNA-methyltransferase